MSERKCIAAKAIYRDSNAADVPAIAALEASGYANAGVSEAVLAATAEAISIVAELDGEVVGHILLTPVAGPERALALDPLAILPAWRDMQIGTELVRHALRLARQKNWHSVFVFGQPDYYCRFGFKSRTADGAEIACQGPRFLALELKKGALAGWTGPLVYPDAYAELFTTLTQR
ncbi:putative acetyltransferase [Hoeflea sp. IMCC20628]|uniref:GNAT family N-acetyltransferase n=1 Tax=Hoeflea sp. IMCC20628 TaxID=1620421 RepID=UPI00063AA397|nr:N-acetyltransferase [Hoeflea sp. IMCC20628]AKI03103.1 putative acetyltransferase [Hoeflea sp. IMCC20628]